MDFATQCNARHGKGGTSAGGLPALARAIASGLTAWALGALRRAPRACAAAACALVAAAVVAAGTPATARAQEGQLVVDGFTTESGRGLVAFTSSSGNIVYCVQPEKDYPIHGGALTYSQWDWVGEARGLDCDPHSLAYVMWRISGNEVGFETPVASTSVSTWMLFPEDKFWIDFERGVYSNATMDYEASIYEGPGDRISPNDVDKIRQVVQEAKDHAGQAGEWDHAGKVWYSPDDAKQSVVELIPSPATGHVEVRKASGNPGITDGNGCYSLEGAVYGVFLDDGGNVPATRGDGSQFTLTTDANGWGRVDGIPAGEGACYFVREIAHSRGYELDPQVYRAPLNRRGDVARVDSVEPPADDPIRFTVQKVDDAGSLHVGLSRDGAATCDGAEFTVRYYDNTTGDVGGEPKRTWLFRTVFYEGVSRAGFDIPGSLVSGELYYDDYGKPTIPVGYVTVQETKAPEGYLLSDGSVHVARVYQDENGNGQIEKVGGWSTKFADVDALNLAVEDQVKRGGISLLKRDAESGKVPQGDASLAGIRFDIVNRNDNPVMVDGHEYQPGEAISGRLVTNAAGEASTASDLLPYGTYEIVEAETNESMRRTAGSQWATVSEDGQVVRFETKDKKESPFVDEVVRGGVRVGKVDRESRLHEPQGKATLEGAVLTITNRSENPVKVDGKSYAPGQVVCELTTGRDGKAETGAETLPYGTYEVREKTPPRGYLPNAEWSKTFEIREDKAIVDLSAPENSVDDQSIRGNLAGVKVGEGSMERLANVPFVIKSTTTGEAHVLVTDENGELDTDSWPHTQRTNANDSAIEQDADGQWRVRDGATLDTDAGIWFAGYSDFSKNAKPDDALGALPFDTYTVSEVRCDANRDWRLLSFDVTIRRHGKVVNVGTLDDEALPKLYTFAHAEGGEEQEVVAEGTVRLTDTVSYKHLEPGCEYTLTGTLHVRDDDGTDGGELRDAQGRPVTGTAKFKALSADGTADVAFEFDSSILDGRDLVSFERCTTVENDVEKDVADHEDISDELQTVRVIPKIGTTATDPVDGDHEVPSTGIVSVRDEVRYTALRPGREHVVTGTLVDKATGKALLDGEGKAVTSSKAFVPESPSGSVTIEFEVDGSLLAGRTAVAFESVSRDGTEVATHADINDESQTVTFPKIGTTATVDGKKEATASAKLTVRDEVAYENLVAGYTYTLTGTLMDKTTGEPLAGADGRPVTATATFTPQDTSGTTSLDLTFDATALGDGEFVVFEELRKGDEKVAEHKDIDDRGQTVTVRPKIGTTATDPVDSDHEVPSTGKVTVTDEVRYEGLRPGTEYTVSGRLVDKATGDAICDAAGKEIAASKTFRPERGSGSVVIEFAVDGSLLAGRTAVAFESVSRDGIEVATHADINDEDQTVTFPKIGTSAQAETKSEGGRETVTVTDRVSYENLVPGTEYRLSGTLADKATGETVKDASGDEATAEAKVTPESADGTADVTFEFDRSLTAGKVVVVFEELRKGDEKVAEHADLGDEAQTFETPTLRTTATDNADGDKYLSGVEASTVRDEVAYEGLIPGREYTVSGTLVDKATGEPVRGADDNATTATQTFVAEAERGTVTLEFEVAAGSAEGRTIVAFEDLLRDGRLVATHADIDDEAQTVYGAAIGTTATDKADGDKAILAATGQTVVDTVSYVGLAPGREYTLTGTLHSKDGSKDAGMVRSEALSDDATVYALDGGVEYHLSPNCPDLVDAPLDRVLKLTKAEADRAGFKPCSQVKSSETVRNRSAAATGTVTFTPDSPSGTVRVEIPLDAERLADADLVAFEELSTKDGDRTQRVAEHKDLGDAAQTVHVDSPSVLRTLAQTGRNLALLAAIGAAFAGLAVAIRAWRGRRR